MSEPDSQSPSEAPGNPPSADQRYAQLEVGDQVVIYDRQNHQAWVQSDAAVSTDSMA
ncbi:DUF7331 family protein [Salinirussus salinus]|uniref:DUF7331 family protein n=1 Tax=Salinirussus salinus TaxID=1198300 RepID=UPI0019157530|nr:hypothetical protein [Salinirussus salinus]